MATLDEAIAKIGALPQKPAFMIHTGDITHLSKPEEFDNADQAIGKARLDTFYVPGEHDIIDADLGKAYLERYGKRVQAKGTGWYSFDQNGVHFVGLVNVAEPQVGRHGRARRRATRLARRRSERQVRLDPDRAVRPHPVMDRRGEMGLGHRRCRPARSDLVKRFGSVTVLNGHIHQVMQKVEGTVTFHTARSTAFPQPAPGTAPSPGPMRVPDDKLRTVLGITEVSVKQGTQPLAITDSELVKA